MNGWHLSWFYLIGFGCILFVCFGWIHVWTLYAPIIEIFWFWFLLQVSRISYNCRWRSTMRVLFKSEDFPVTPPSAPFEKSSISTVRLSPLRSHTHYSFHLSFNFVYLGFILLFNSSIFCLSNLHCFVLSSLYFFFGSWRDLYTVYSNFYTK